MVLKISARVAASGSASIARVSVVRASTNRFISACPIASARRVRAVVLGVSCGGVGGCGGVGVTTAWGGGVVVGVVVRSRVAT